MSGQDTLLDAECPQGCGGSWKREESLDVFAPPGSVLPCLGAVVGVTCAELVPCAFGFSTKPSTGQDELGCGCFQLGWILMALSALVLSQEGVWVLGEHKAAHPQESLQGCLWGRLERLMVTCDVRRMILPLPGSAHTQEQPQGLKFEF